jgi:hypothetical protein
VVSYESTFNLDITDGRVRADEKMEMQYSLKYGMSSSSKQSTGGGWGLRDYL